MSLLLTDELPLKELPGTTDWSESYAIMFGDPENGVSAFFSCGRFLEDPTVFREVVGVMLPDGRIFYAKNYGRAIPENGVGGSMAEFTVPTPGETLRLKYEGPLLESRFEDMCAEASKDGDRKFGKLDLTFEGITPIWDMAGDSKEASTIAGSMHIEQIGRVNGSFEIGGETFHMRDGYTVRDHSRGIRNVSKYKAHCWGNGPLDNGSKYFYFYGMQLHGSEATGMSNAIILDGDRVVPATLHADDLFIENVDPTRPYTYRLTSEVGDYTIIMKKVLASFPYSMIFPYDLIPGWVRGRPAAHMFDQLIKYECNGQEYAGWLERGYTSQPL